MQLPNSLLSFRTGHMAQFECSRCHTPLSPKTVSVSDTDGKENMIDLASSVESIIVDEISLIQAHLSLSIAVRKESH